MAHVLLPLSEVFRCAVGQVILHLVGPDEPDASGMSSYGLARTLGVTQTTAWSMLRRIRQAYRPPTPYERFVAFMTRLIAVPKRQVDHARRPEVPRTTP